MQAIFILLLFIPAFWLLIVRPQQKQRRAHQIVVAELQVGQRVMTVGGLIGTLAAVDDETVRIDVGDGTELTFGRTFVRQRVAPDVDVDLTQATANRVSADADPQTETDPGADAPDAGDDR